MFYNLIEKFTITNAAALVLTQGQVCSLLICNFTTEFPKILEYMSKSILIIADFSRNNRLIMSIKQLPSEIFRSVAFFLGYPVVHFKTLCLFVCFSLLHKCTIRQDNFFFLRLL